MIRQRFRDIKPYLYVCDNMQLGNHKMAKFIPMYNVLNNKMQLFGVLHRQLNIDKATVYALTDIISKNSFVESQYDLVINAGC